MADSSGAQPAALTDSPWFWMTAFCAAGLVVLVVIWPKYAQRQRRLEMQYQARQETARRQVDGEPVARPVGAEGDAPPPRPGELIIPLWPIGAVVAAGLAFSVVMLRRSRQHAAAVAARNAARGDPP